VADAPRNLRDLGGLPTSDGRRTRHGAVLRSGTPEQLSAAGWAGLEARGVRTIVDLRNDDELTPDASPRPAGLTTLHLPLDGVEHSDFWEEWGSGPQFATPLYYAPHIERFPERSVRVLKAIAEAPPGGVLVHCVGGRDRSGQVAMLLLALVGVPAEAIAADYALSTNPHDDREIADFLEERGTTTGRIIAETLTTIDVREHLAAHGLSEEDVAALRARLLGPG
jgi:protein-tyrosine phosphatase